MRIVLAPLGTEGDVRPMITLAKIICKLGSEAVICAPPDFEGMVSKHGFQFIAMGSAMKELMGGGEKGINGNPIAAMRYLRESIEREHDLQIEGLVKACNGADFLIGSGPLQTGKTVAEYIHIPYRHLFVSPVFVATPDHTPVLFPWQNIPRILKRLLWRVFFFSGNLMWRKSLNRCRGALGLPPIKDVYSHCYSDVIVSSDVDLTKVVSDPGDFYKPINYLSLDDSEDLGEDLERFLNAGDPPIFIGFGSMTESSKDRMNDLLMDVISETGLRFVLAKGWAGLDLKNTGDKAMVITKPVPHHKLFPRVCMVIHHGGSGTVQTAAKAGKPQIIIPHMFDHFYWGNVVYKNGLGPKPVMRHELSVKRLVSKIREVAGSGDYRRRAEEIGRALCSVDRESDAMEMLKSCMNIRASA